MAKKESTTKTEVKLVSFKLAVDVYEELEEYAKNTKDEAGFNLSPSMAARKLMLEALRRHQQKKS